MRIHRFLLVLVFVSALFGQMTADQKVADFTSLSQFYVRHYTPSNWKQFQFGYDLTNLKPWLEKVKATKNDLEYYDVAIEYLSKLDDGHIRYTLPSNYQAYLRFDVDIYDGKTLIEFISTAFNRREFPIEIGDEVVSVDDVTSEAWIERFRRYSIGANERATRRRAADYITFRPQVSIPWAADIGENAKVVIRKPDGAEATYMIPWSKNGTAIKNLPPVGGPRFATRESTGLRDPKDRYGRMAEQWGVSNEERQVEAGEALSDFEREQRSSQLAEAHPVDTALVGLGQFVPLFDVPAGFRLRLGASATDLFLSGTFVVDGKTIGFIRIPTFNPTNTTLALSQFRAEVIALQALTSGLVIDVMHNPGGNVCYAQELMRYLVPKLFWGVGYWIKPTQVWKTYFEGRTLNANSVASTPVWERQLLAEYYQLVSSAYDAGTETGVYPICASSVTAQPQDVVYTKPILMITNEFSVSAADAFPAMFQDAGRGKIVGFRTGGLGGNVNDYFNTGITEANLRVTRSLIIRENAVPSPSGPTRFIENVGVTPDVTIDFMTRDNLVNDGKPFTDAWIEELKKILQ